MKELLLMYLAFAKVGVSTFGGGYAMLPMLQRELADKRGWTTQEELMDYYAIGQCTPGVIAVNVSTFIGYKRKGIPGAIAATLGMITPSLIIITCIAALISNFSDNIYVQKALAGINVAVLVLVINAISKMFKKALVDWLAIVMFVVTALVSIITRISPVIFVVACGVIGVIYQTLKAKKAAKDAASGKKDGEAEE